MHDGVHRGQCFEAIRTGIADVELSVSSALITILLFTFFGKGRSCPDLVSEIHETKRTLKVPHTKLYTQEVKRTTH